MPQGGCGCGAVSWAGAPLQAYDICRAQYWGAVRAFAENHILAGWPPPPPHLPPRRAEVWCVTLRRGLVQHLRPAVGCAYVADDSEWEAADDFSDVREAAPDAQVMSSQSTGVRQRSDTAAEALQSGSL